MISILCVVINDVNNETSRTLYFHINIGDFSFLKNFLPLPEGPQGRFDTSSRESLSGYHLTQENTTITISSMMIYDQSNILRRLTIRKGELKQSFSQV